MARPSAPWRLPLLLVALFAASCASPPPRDEAWLTNYAEAEQAAAAGKKALLLEFTGSDWCPSCKKLRAEVFEQPEFKQWAEQNAVLLELDFPRVPYQSSEEKKQNRELQEKFRIEVYPTVVFLDAAGKELGRHGYAAGGPGPWIAKADEILRSSGR